MGVTLLWDAQFLRIPQAFLPGGGPIYDALFDELVRLKRPNRLYSSFPQKTQAEQDRLRMQPGVFGLRSRSRPVGRDLRPVREVVHTDRGRSAGLHPPLNAMCRAARRSAAWARGLVHVADTRTSRGRAAVLSVASSCATTVSRRSEGLGTRPGPRGQPRGARP